MIENKNNSDSELEKSIIELKELYNINPNLVQNEVHRFNLKLQNIIDSKQPEAVKKRNNLITLIVLSAIILLEGLLLFVTDGPKDKYIIYAIGYAFFIFSHHFGMTQKGSGIVILLTVGSVGLSLMVDACIHDIVSTPIMTDIPTDYASYLYTTLSLFIIATLYVIAYNLSDRIKEIKYSRYIPLLMYIVAFGMTIGFNYLIK